MSNVRPIKQRKVDVVMDRLRAAGISYDRFMGILSATPEQVSAVEAAWPPAPVPVVKTIVRDGVSVSMRRVFEDRRPHAIFNPQFEESRFGSFHAPIDVPTDGWFDFFDIGWSVHKIRKHCRSRSIPIMSSFTDYEYLWEYPGMLHTDEPRFRRIFFRSEESSFILFGTPEDAVRQVQEHQGVVVPSARILVMALLHYWFSHRHEWQSEEMLTFQHFAYVSNDVLPNGKNLRVGFYNGEIDVTFRLGTASQYGRRLYVPRLAA